jgi:hypothetical protein
MKRKRKRSHTRPLVAIVHWHDAGVEHAPSEDHDHLLQLSAGIVLRYSRHSIKLALLVPCWDGDHPPAREVITIPEAMIRSIQWVTVAEPPPDY